MTVPHNRPVMYGPAKTFDISGVNITSAQMNLTFLVPILRQVATMSGTGLAQDISRRLDYLHDLFRLDGLIPWLRTI